MERRLVAVACGLVLLADCTGKSPVAAPVSTPAALRATSALPGRPPERIEAHFYVCPPGFEVAAYGQVFYLPNHPSHPTEATRPDRCFSSAGQARGAGYRDAPVPPGVLVIGGVFLVPPDGALMTYCQRAAERLHRSVPCPTLVPGQADSMDECVGGGSCFVGGRFLVWGEFRGPPSYRGISPGGGHINIWSGSPALLKHGYFGCPWGHTTGSARVGRRAAEWVVCPLGSSLDSGHVILQWRTGGLIYGVSIHGHTALNRRLARVIAAHQRLVRP